MPNASDIAARKYDVPLAIPRIRTNNTLPYSCHAPDIFRHLSFHRICFADDIPRLIPEKISSSRAARKHLESIAVEGHIDVLQFADRQKSQIYVLNDEGHRVAERYVDTPVRPLPSKVVQPKGDHVLHEALITEIASRREHFFKTTPGYKRLWKERYGFHAIPGFEEFIPDYADAYRGPQGIMVDFVEVLTGEESSTQVLRKLKKAEEWYRSPESAEFFRALHQAIGGNPDTHFCRFPYIAHNRNLVGTDYSWLREILNKTFKVHPEIQRRVWITTNDRIREKQSLDAPIWHCGADLVKYGPQFRDTPTRRQFGYISEVLEREPTYPLFSFIG